jgi:hypothetical protein
MSLPGISSSNLPLTAPPFPLVPRAPPSCFIVSCDTKRKKYARTRGHGREAIVVAKTLGNFEFQRCTAWKEIAQRFGDRVKITHVRSIAIALHILFPDHLPRLSRTENRRFSLIIKWFDDHWTFISQVISYIALMDDTFEEVTLA